MSSSNLIAPYGGALRQLMLSKERKEQLQEASMEWPSVDLTRRQVCDLEMLLCGGFSPLTGFMEAADYEGVLEQLRLPDGTLWPMPITLDVSEEVAATLAPGQRVALRDPEGVMLGSMLVKELYRPDRRREAELVFGTTDTDHPGVDQLLNHAGPVYVGGQVEGWELPVHYDFRLLRHTPAELRRAFAKRGWRRVVAFQSRNPIHRPQMALTQYAIRQTQANLLVHPVVGATQPGDVDHYTRVRCYQAIEGRYPRHTMMISLLPLAMRMAGPREAMLHAIVRRNYGCTHFIVGPDQASPVPNAAGEPFYPRFAAQRLITRHAEELGIEMVPVKEMAYVPELRDYMFKEEVPKNMGAITLSGAKFRRRLAEGKQGPDWYSFSEVQRELMRTYPARHRQGFTVFFTGLSGAGKSTVANVLMVRLLEMGGRPVTLLDGDIVRKHLSSELNFSKEHRDINIRRIGFVAAEISKNGGIAICAPIAPYHRVRKEVRQMVSEGGGFILVHVATPLSVCESRDRKGMYAKARAGLITGFTGIDDPYEEPDDAELYVDTTGISPSEAAMQVLLYLEKEGYIGGDMTVRRRH